MERGPPAIYLINAAFISTAALVAHLYTYGLSIVPYSGTPWMVSWYRVTVEDGNVVITSKIDHHIIPEPLLSRGLGPLGLKV